MGDIVDVLPTAIILAGVGVVFVLACYSIARVAYFDERARADLLIACYRLVSFAVALVGCLAVSEIYGNAASAVFAAAVCAGSIATGIVLAKSWRAGEAAERAQLEELRATVEAYRASEDSAESRCARIARERGLTRREEEVLLLLLEGATRPEIARRLYVSGDTVKTHVRNLYRKVGVADKGELAKAVDAR